MQMKEELDISMWTGAALSFDELGRVLCAVMNLSGLSSPPDSAAISALPVRTRIREENSVFLFSTVQLIPKPHADKSHGFTFSLNSQVHLCI